MLGERYVELVVHLAAEPGVHRPEDREGFQPSTAQRGDSALAAMLWKRGRSVMQLDIALPVAASGREERLALPARASGVTRASFAMPYSVPYEDSPIWYG